MTKVATKSVKPPDAILRRMEIPLQVTSPASVDGRPQPVTFGLALPQGEMSNVLGASIRGLAVQDIPAAPRVTACWPDGSVQWVLIDAVIASAPAGRSSCRLELTEGVTHVGLSSLRTVVSKSGVEIQTGAATFRIGADGLLHTNDSGCGLATDRLQLWLTDKNGRRHAPQLHLPQHVFTNPISAEVLIEGEFLACRRMRVAARLRFSAGTGVVRADVALHNPRRAKHVGGLWDLGDAGSICFKDFSLEVTRAASDGPNRIAYRPQSGGDLQSIENQKLEIYQDSSGGENWNGPNHVNARGETPLHFRGYRVRAGSCESAGVRAEPIVALSNRAGAVAVAVPEFWQQFPKAIEADGSGIRVGLFPRQFGDHFELQGGERKTHRLWLDFAADEERAGPPLDWVHQPVAIDVSRHWWLQTSLFAGIGVTRGDALDRLDVFLESAWEGRSSLLAKREQIDEYGWRNYGDIFADHEQAYYTGSEPFVSHHNNQYDLIYGFLLQFLRTGRRDWFEAADVLARHVMDIDIYHTREDKAAYNGGLFWMTDHYVHAHTATHRTYSRRNRQPKMPYGGGPGCEFNFTSGLLLYHRLTGSEPAREAVLGLAEWVIRMDDGRSTIMGVLDDGPTGLASRTREDDYHGPGRGAGNSINALLDAWTLSKSERFLDYAEQLIRRCIHPADDISARELLDAERRWSYTVFLATLAKYLELKGACHRFDAAYHYARLSLLHYARWMVEHESSYLDRREQLEFVTETWPAQDLRKANVLRHAARHAEVDLRRKLLVRGTELAERAWADLLAFERPATTRSLALVLIEGLWDCHYRTADLGPAPLETDPGSFGRPRQFIPQKKRVLTDAKTLAHWPRLIARLCNPARWSDWWSWRRAMRNGDHFHQSLESHHDKRTLLNQTSR